MYRSINKVAVLGAGIMGSGIAAHIVGAGIPVCLLGNIPSNLTKEEEQRGYTLESKEVRNSSAQIGKARVTNPKARLIYDKSLGDMIEIGNMDDNLDMLKDCDWIIEVIVEDLEVKRNLFKKILKYTKPGAIISTNTSGISINTLVEEMTLEEKKHFMGTHFFNPPRYMKLFELIPNESSDDEIMEFIANFATHRLGKGVVRAKDTPNFIGNRIGTFSIINVLQLMEKYGYDIVKVDQLTGSILGRPKSATFKTLDMVGLDIFNNVANNVINNIQDEGEKSKHVIPDFVINLVAKGHLGDKVGQGFYKKIKTDKGKQQLVWDKNQEDYVEMTNEVIEAINLAAKEKNKLRAMVYGELEENKFVWEHLKNILLYSASKIPEIADDYKEIDNAMVWGYNWNLGPFQIWDKIGVEESIMKMKQEGEDIPLWIEKKIKSGSTNFYDEKNIETPYLKISNPQNKIIKENNDAALIDIGSGVACLEFRTKSNVITENIVDLIEHSLEVVEKEYKGLVIGNESSNFSSGFDLVLLSELAKNKKWYEIYQLVSKFHKVNMAMKYAKRPVVAAPFGMTLGGGAEITMHTHKVVAHAETYMGLVELGVGLVPGGGGIKEMLIKGIENLGKLSDGEAINHVKKVWRPIATAMVSGSAHEAIKTKYLRGTDKIIMNRDYLIDEAKKEVLQMYDNGFKQLQKNKIPVLGTSGRAAIEYDIDFMLNGKFISKYDAFLAKQVARIMTGGNLPGRVMVSEEHILELEKEAFVGLCGEEKTIQRIEHMIKTGKPLRN